MKYTRGYKYFCLMKWSTSHLQGPILKKMGVPTKRFSWSCIITIYHNSLADLGGIPGARLPLKVQILSFQHTNIHNHLGSLQESTSRPPTGNPGSATAIYCFNSLLLQTYKLFNCCYSITTADDLLSVQTNVIYCVK